ncbi:hypothetical protein D3C75_853610 [compost metagenome]
MLITVSSLVSLMSSRMDCSARGWTVLPLPPRTVYPKLLINSMKWNSFSESGSSWIRYRKGTFIQ